MAKKLAAHDLSRRERQILDILYREGQATALEVQKALPSAPSYSAVRALLRILEGKGHVRHQEDGAKYVYAPAISRDRAKRSALRHVVNTFFGGSPSQAAAALLDEDVGHLTPDDIERLEAAIDRARRDGK